MFVTEIITETGV